MLQEPQAQAQQLVKSCPMCRRPLAQIMRYGRPLNHMKVQHADMNFFLYSTQQLLEAEELYHAASKAAQESAGSPCAHDNALLCKSVMFLLSTCFPDSSFTCSVLCGSSTLFCNTSQLECNVLTCQHMYSQLLFAGASQLPAGRQPLKIHLDRMVVGYKHAIRLTEQAAFAYQAVIGLCPPTVRVLEATRQGLLLA